MTNFKLKTTTDTSKTVHVDTVNRRIYNETTCPTLPQTRNTVYVHTVNRRIHSETKCPKHTRVILIFQLNANTESGKSTLRYHMQKKTMNFIEKKHTQVMTNVKLKTTTETGISARTYHTQK